MKINSWFMVLAVGCLGINLWAAPPMAPAVPDLTLPDEQQEATREVPSRPVVIYKNATVLPNRPVARPVAPKAQQNMVQPVSPSADQEEVVVTNSSINQTLEYVEKIKPDLSKLMPIPTLSELPEVDSTEFEPARDNASTAMSQKTFKVVYKPASDRDPTLSPEDSLLIKDIQARERRRIEAERKQRIEAEKRRIADLERQRQLELERLRDPSREVRGKIKISGIIGQEVFIGNKVYTVGNSVRGARIVSVRPDAVVFTYKGQKFTKKVQLQ